MIFFTPYKSIFTFFLLIFIQFSVHGQTLKNFTNKDTLYHSYKLNGAQLLYLKNQNGINDTSWLFENPYKKTTVSLATQKDTMDYGSYLEAVIVDNIVNYQLIQNIPFTIISKKINNDIVFFLKSKEINNKLPTNPLISNATLFCKETILKFDSSYGGYPMSALSLKKGQDLTYITVYYNYQYYLINVDYYPEYKSKKQKYNKSFNPLAYGYSVTDKPLYKLGDSLRFKAYIVNNQTGEPIEKEALLTIKDKITYKTVFSKTIKNTSPGSYLLEWLLPDTLLQDRKYQIEIGYIENKKFISRTTDFRIEDYVLDKSNINFSPKKTNYKAGETIEFSANTTDANGFPIGDVRLQYVVSIETINGIEPDTLSFRKYQLDSLFHIDTLLPYEKVHEFKIAYTQLPNASMQLKVEGTLTDPQFEKQEFTYRINYISKKEETVLYQKEDSISIRYLYLNKDTQKIFTLKCYNSRNKLVDSFKVTTPYNYKLNSSILKAELYDSTKLISSQKIFYNSLSIVNLKGNRTSSEQQISFKYPFEEPVYYRIFNKNKLLSKGCEKQINFTIKDSSLDDYSILIAHNLNGEIENNFYKISFYPLNKSIKIQNSLPEKAFPGQTIPIELTATDWYGNPVPNFNMTSYAVNGQFKENLSEPFVVIPENLKMATYTEHFMGTYSNISFSYLNLRKTIPIQKVHITRFDLYKNEFYQLLFPEKGFKMIQNKKQLATPEITVIVTYKGKTYAPKYFMLDNDLWAVSEANNSKSYSFVCDTGYKNILVRAFDVAINIPKVYISPYTKHYIALNLDSIYAKNYSPQLTISDSLSLSIPSPMEQTKIENSLLFFQEIQVDSLLVATNNEYYSKRFKFNADYFNTIQIDDDNYKVMGPFENGNISFNTKSQNFSVFTGRYIHYYDFNNKTYTSKEISPRSTIKLNFTDQSMDYADIPYQYEQDTIVSTNLIYTKKLEPKAPPLRNYFEPSIYDFSNVKEAPKFQIQLFNSSENRITNCWIINKTDKYSSQYFSETQNNTRLYIYNTSTPIDVYFFTNNHTCRILKNIRYNEGTILCIHADSLKTYEIDENELALPINIFNKITKIPKLPFYYHPEESNNLKLETSEFLNSEGKAHLSGSVIDNGLAPIENTYIILEQYGKFKQGAYTNAKGEFEFLEVPSGVYDIKIYHPNYTLRYYYKVALGGMHQQYFSSVLNEKEVQNPLFESITNNYRFSVFEKESKNSLEIDVYDIETRQLLKNCSVIFNYAGIEKEIKNIELENILYTNKDNKYKVQISKQGYKTFVFDVIEANITNETHLDVFLSKSITKEKNMEQYSLSLEELEPNETFITENKYLDNNEIKTGSITGNVKDENGNAIPYAQVVIVEDVSGTKMTGKGAKANAQGIYTIRGIPPGRIHVLAKALGKPKTIKSNIEIKPGKTLLLNFELEDNTKSIKQVMVMSSRKSKTKLIDVFTPKENTIGEAEISEHSQRDVNSMASSVGSVIYEDKGADLKVAGARSDESVVYIDGMKVSGYKSESLQIEDEEEEDEDEKPIQKTEMEQLMDEMIISGKGNQYRKNFSDVGYWLPNIVTDKYGKATALITLPDNITQWKSYTIGMGAGFQYGQTSQLMRAFKPLQTTTYSPSFLHLGDSIVLKAKYTNLMADSKKCALFFELDTTKIKHSEVEISNFVTDSVLISARSLSPISFTAGLEYEKKYTDAENVKIPILPNIITIYNNQSIYAEKDSSYTLYFKPNTKGNIIFNNSIYENILKYIDDLNNYQYGCVEQTASKLKALVYQQGIYNKLNIKKNLQKQINQIAKKLEDMQNKNGSFGWWKHGEDNIYMTTYAYEALALAGNRNYNSYSSSAGNYLSDILKKRVHSEMLYPAYILVKNGFYDINKIDLKSIDERALNTTEKIYYYKLKQLQGEPIENATWYALTLELKKNSRMSHFDNFFNDPKATVFNAYTIFKGTSVEKEFKDKFKDEIYKGVLATHLNTFSKAALIEAMLSDATQNKETILSKLKINDKQEISTFPYTIPIENSSINIAHSGAPIWINTAEEESIEYPIFHDSIFSINTEFSQNLKPTTHLSRGLKTQLNVTVMAYKSKEYVMIEIPLPAGVIVKNKKTSQDSKDYIEYKKDKIIIYKSKITMGLSSFTFDIEPIYSGHFNIPPAQISMMYYPYVYGNNLRKNIKID